MNLKDIDVDYALSSSLTQEELAYVFGSKFEWHSEEYLVQGIKKHLRSENDKILMNRYDFTIEDMLNGRIEGTEAQEVAADIFRRWNARLGFRAFGF